MFHIGEFSKMSKATIKTLHYYDEIGLLKPEMTDKFTSYRLYTTEQLVKLHKIQSFRQAGLSINEIQEILSGHGVKDILQKRKAELISELEDRNKQLSQIEFILKGEKGIMNYAVAVKELPKCIVYSKRLTILNYEEYFEVVPKIGEELMKKYPDLKCATPNYCFVVHLDGEHKEKDINIEFCEAVTKIVPDFNDIKFKEMPPITVASVMHKGSYSDLGKAYAFAMKWIQENGYAVADNPRESYIDGIWNKESEQDWLTEIQIPITK
ncbi:MAG: MerR family transcriptional regulator [Defluviitaleaceae bacterium]|nr:MerR family transcriptional regulator [Defluviitaleaceae bacterium]